MIIKTGVIEDKEYCGRDRFIMEIDGVKALEVCGGEPEDFTLYRDLKFVLGIPKLLVKAHERGVAGESIEIMPMTQEELAKYDWD